MRRVKSSTADTIRIELSFELFAYVLERIIIDFWGKVLRHDVLRGIVTFRAVLASDTLTALTELNAKAREAREMEERMKTK